MRIGVVANTEFNLNQKKFVTPPSVILNESEGSLQFVTDSSEAQNDNMKAIVIDAQLEAELAQLEDNDRQEYLKELGLTESGLEKIISEAYKTLGLITFITAGPKESKAWTCELGTKAPQAAGKIHTDFEHGFIRAEVIQWDKLLEAGSYAGARSKGWLRIEGKEYIVQDGDVSLITDNNLPPCTRKELLICSTR